MATYSPNSPIGSYEWIPSGLRTMLPAMLRHRYIAIACILGATTCGVAGAYRFGSRTWRAETSLLYASVPKDGAYAGDDASRPFSARSNPVRIRATLEETKRRLGLDVKTETLERAIEVFVHPETGLLTIGVTWGDAEKAAAIANTVRDVFVESQQRLRQNETQTRSAPPLERVEDDGESKFTVISEAQAPARPYRSNRRSIFFVILFLGGAVGAGIALLAERLDSTVKCATELRLEFDAPVLGDLPHAGYPVFSGLPRKARSGNARIESPLMESFRIISRRMRASIPKRGARVLVASAHHGEGRSLATVCLASCLGRQDAQVLVVDASIHGSDRKAAGEEGGATLLDLIPEGGRKVIGLGTYLSREADTLDEVTWATVFPGVDGLPYVGTGVLPEELASPRMRDLLEEASARYGLVLMDAPPVLPYGDAEWLARTCDAVLFVVRSRWRKIAEIRQAVDRLDHAETPLIGMILNDVDSLYLETG